MRARLALSYSGIELEHREILLKDKPKEMLEASPKGTVPVLVLPDGNVIDESFDVMLWALNHNDPDAWLSDYNSQLIQDNDTWFKRALDRYKYPNRYPDEDCSGALNECLKFLDQMEAYLTSSSRPTLTDMAIFPFIRQFSKVDSDMFDTLDFSKVKTWLDKHLESNLFQEIMKKHPVWA